MSRRTITVALAACMAGGLAAGGVATAVFRTAGTPSATPDISPRNGDRGVLTRFAHAAGREDRMVLLQRTADGYVCLWDTPDTSNARGVGGCNPAASPLGGRKLFVSLAFDGGPAVSDAHDARLSGLVAPDVAAAEVVMTDGSTRSLPIAPLAVSARSLAGGSYRAFAYRVADADLQSGIGPVAVVARNSKGEVVDRQATGIG